MYRNGNDAYLESRVNTADALELVRMLYHAGTAAVRDARSFLSAGDIAARSRAISKACDVLFELKSSLDHERGGELSQRLERLYDYMCGRLLEANLRQSDEPLAETLGLLTTLSEAWDGLRTGDAPSAAVSNTRADAPRTESAWEPPAGAQTPVWEQSVPAESGYGSHSWSF